jgi:hypothetical protein
MGKLISFILQMIVLKKSFAKTVNPMDYLEKTGEKARGYFLFSIGCLLGMIFLLIALVVAIIAVGLQIEQHGAISFNGLMISAAIFLALSVFVFIISSILLVIQKQKMLERIREKEREMASHSHITPLVEEILKQILVNLSQPKKNSDKEPGN